MGETALYIVPNKARQEQISTTNCLDFQARDKGSLSRDEAKQAGCPARGCSGAWIQCVTEHSELLVALAVLV